MGNDVTATLEARDLQAIDKVIYQAPGGTCGANHV